MKTFFLMLVIGSCLFAHAADPTVKKAVKLDEQATGNLILTIDTAKPVNEDTPQTLTLKAADPAAESNGKQDARLTGTVTITTDAVKPAKGQTPRSSAIKGADATLKVDEGATGNFIYAAAVSDDAKANAKKPMAFVLTTVEAAKPTPFKDKIVRVQAVAGNRTEIFTLESVKLTTLLGSEFITGTAVKYRSDRFSGLEVYLNLRNVLTIVAMTPEEAKKFNEMQQPRSGQRPNYPPGFNPDPQFRGQGPYPPQGFNPQQNQGPNPPQGFNPQPGYSPPQGGQGPNMPPQGNNPPRGGPPQGGQGPNMPPQGYNPPQGSQPDWNQPQEPSDPDSR